MPRFTRWKPAKWGDPSGRPRGTPWSLRGEGRSPPLTSGQWTARQLLVWVGKLGLTLILPIWYVLKPLALQSLIEWVRELLSPLFYSSRLTAMETQCFFLHQASLSGGYMQPASQLRITNLHHLALALDLSESQMLILARRAPLMYCKRQHGKRTLLVPQSYLKRVQQKIVRLLMTRLAFPKSLQGGLRGRSAIGNARIHVGRHYLGQTDIRSFFPSVRPRMVYDAFVARGCAPDVARILTQLTTTHHQLPQGAPSSPVVANLVLWRFAERFEGLARSYGVMASVYLDDITLSGGKVVLRLKEKVLAMIRQLGLRPHPDETKTIFDATDKERVVTGVRVDGLTIAAPSEYIAKLEVAIKTLRDTGVIATQLKSIRGRIGYVRQLDRNEAARLSTLLQATIKPAPSRSG